jgi:hypothetical protein
MQHIGNVYIATLITVGRLEPSQNHSQNISATYLTGTTSRNYRKQSTNLKEQNFFYFYNVTCTMNCNYTVAKTLFTVRDVTCSE